MGIKGIHHIALKCNGLQEFSKTVKFYKDILGLKLVRAWGSGKDMAMMLDTGAGVMEIFANAEDKPNVGAIRHFAFNVDDTAETVEKVRKAGYKITMEPTNIVIPSNPPYPAKIAFCIGPVGEEIEFFEEK